MTRAHAMTRPVSHLRANLAAVLLLLLLASLVRAAGAQEEADPLAVLADREAYARLGAPEVEALVPSMKARWAEQLSGLEYLGVHGFAAGGSAHQLASFRHRASGLVFVLVPGGRFWMGSEGPVGKPDADETRHEVLLAPFLVSRTECTRGAWKKVAAAVEGLAPEPSCAEGRERLPVDNVSARDADAWCRAAGLALPTEAQWEYACRAGTTTWYSWGDEVEDLRKYANVADASSGFDWKEPWNDGHPGTAPVGSFEPNAFGLMDVHGNLWEWCRDSYGSYAAPVAAGTGARQVPAGERVARGGSFRATAKDVRSAFRYAASPGYAFCFVGFRPVIDLP